MEKIEDDKPICIREVNENLRRVRLNQELTRPLKQLNEHCEFRRKYNEWCDIEDGIEHFKPLKRKCKICNKEFLAKYHTQICCSKKCSKDRIKEYYEKNKDKITKRKKEYYEKNKDKINKKKRERYYEKQRKILPM